MRTLAGIYAELRQGSLHQDAGLGDVAPGYGNAQGGDAGAPSAIADEHVLAAIGLHARVELAQLRGHFHGLHLVKGAGLEVDDVPEAFQPAGPEGAGGLDQRAGAVYLRPVYVRVEAVGGDGPDLQGVEYAGGELGGKFQFYAALHLFAADGKEGLDDGRERVGVVAEDVRERYELGARGEGGVHHALVLEVKGGAHLGEGGELGAFGDGNVSQVYGVVHAGLEFLRLHVERVHGLLGLAEGEVRRGSLEYVFGVCGGEAEHLLAVHHRFAQAVGQLHNAFFGLFVADGIEIHAARHA